MSGSDVPTSDRRALRTKSGPRSGRYDEDSLSKPRRPSPYHKTMGFKISAAFIFR
jgi:hypothetical protein